MSQFRLKLRAEDTRRVLLHEFALEATIENTSSQVAQISLAQARIPSLVLEVRDDHDQRVHLPPPPVPDKKFLILDEIEAGQSATVRYSGLHGMRLDAGTYRVRYAASSPALGGSEEDPIFSNWIEFSVREDSAAGPPSAPPESVGSVQKVPIGDYRVIIIDCIRRFFHWLLCIIRWLFGHRCNRILTMEVEEQLTETISNAPAGLEEWNGTYPWTARFHVSVDEARCRLSVTVRVRINGALTGEQRKAWEKNIEDAWSNRFKACCYCCCCRKGYHILTDIQFVNGGEHQIVTVGDSTLNMGEWGRNDTTRVRHEFGHMLGALDEYFTVNGVDFGMYDQADGNIMNNSQNYPVAHHYDLIQSAIQDLLGTSCRTISVNHHC